MGTTEELDLGLKVLSVVLPRFFKGAIEAANKVSKVNVNKHAGMSSKSREILERHMATEIEFYDFVRQRVGKMARLFGVGPKASLLPDVLHGFP